MICLSDIQIVFIKPKTYAEISYFYQYFLDNLCNVLLLTLSYLNKFCSVSL